MDPDILEEEFGSELGDINSSKWFDTLMKPKKDAACKQNNKQKKRSNKDRFLFDITALPAGDRSHEVVHFEFNHWLCNGFNKSARQGKG